MLSEHPSTRTNMTNVSAFETPERDIAPRTNAILDSETIKLLTTGVASTNTRCFNRKGIAMLSIDDASPPSTTR